MSTSSWSLLAGSILALVAAIGLVAYYFISKPKKNNDDDELDDPSL